MSTVHDPVEKKRQSYERDHYAKGAKSDKGFRQTWPRKKRKASRASRHAAEIITRTVAQRSEPETDLALIKKTEIKKWPVLNLREDIAAKLDRRVKSVGAKQARRQSLAEYQSKYRDDVPASKRVWATIKDLPHCSVEQLQDLKQQVLEAVRKREQGIASKDEYGSLTPKQFAPAVRETLKAIGKLLPERILQRERAEKVLSCR